MRRYPVYIFDLDGTLYRGSEAIAGAPEVLAQLRREGAQVRFLTNNSSLAPDTQAEKLQKLGFDARPDEVLTSGMGAAGHLLHEGLRSCFVVGEPGLKGVLVGAGVAVLEGSPVDAVVAGICRHFSYALLDEAMQRIRAGARFVATNTDVTYPMEAGRVVPGAGAIVAAIRACSEVDPFVIGKPNPLMVLMTLDRCGVAASDALVVGDRYETDILAGRHAGCDTLLVMTGVTSEAPDGQLWAESLDALLR